MKHSEVKYLFFIYSIIKGEKNYTDFKRPARLSDFNGHDDIIKFGIYLRNIIDNYKLEINLEFDEEPFLDSEGTKRGINWSRLDDYTESALEQSFDIQQDFYDEKTGEPVNVISHYKKFFKANIKIAREGVNKEWLFEFIDAACVEKNNVILSIYKAVLLCVQFDIYKKNNVKIIQKKLFAYIDNFSKNNLEATDKGNFFNYENNKSHLIKILDSNIKKYGNTFLINYEVLAQCLSEFRYLETLIAFELLENYLEIKKLYFKKKELYCLLTVKERLIKKLGVNIKTENITNKASFREGVLSINGANIDYKRKENQSCLLATLFKHPKNNYFYIDVTDDWGEEFEKGKGWRKVYTAGDEINKSVAIETGIKDFIIKDTKKIQINPKYI